MGVRFRSRGSGRGLLFVDTLPPTTEAKSNTVYLRRTDLSLHYTRATATPSTPASSTTPVLTDTNVTNSLSGLTVEYLDPQNSTPANPSAGNIRVYLNVQFLMSGYGFTSLRPNGTTTDHDVSDILNIPSGNSIHLIGNWLRPGTATAVTGTMNIDATQDLIDFLNINPNLVSDINGNSDRWYLYYDSTSNKVRRVTAFTAAVPAGEDIDYEPVGFASLGPETNMFSGANRAAAVAARNTFATANADWLSIYSSYRFLYIELSFGDTREYQARNVAGTGWETITGFARGEPGPGAEFTGITLTAGVLTFQQTNGNPQTIDLNPLISGLLTSVTGSGGLRATRTNNVIDINLPDGSIAFAHLHADTVTEIISRVNAGIDINTDTTIDGDGSTSSPLSVANPFTNEDETKLDGIEAGATGDQTDEEIRDALQRLSDDDRLDATAVKNLPDPGGSATPLSDDHPLVPGDSSAGTSPAAARSDHRHPPSPNAWIALNSTVASTAANLRTILSSLGRAGEVSRISDNQIGIAFDTGLTAALGRFVHVFLPEGWLPSASAISTDSTGTNFTNLAAPVFVTGDFYRNGQLYQAWTISTFTTLGTGVRILRLNVARDPRFTSNDETKLDGIQTGANEVIPYKIGNVYRATAAGTIPAKPPNGPSPNAGTAASTGITVAPTDWALARMEPTTALPWVFDCHVYGYDINGVFSWQFGTPNRTDRLAEFASEVSSIASGDTVTPTASNSNAIRRFTGSTAGSVTFNTPSPVIEWRAWVWNAGSASLTINDQNGTSVGSLSENEMGFLYLAAAGTWSMFKLPQPSGSGGSGTTNLGRTLAADSVTITSSTGDNANVPAATSSAAGVLSGADKTKLDDLELLRLATVTADGEFATARATTPASNFALATADFTPSSDSPVDASGTALTSVKTGDLFIFDDQDERWERLVTLPASTVTNLGRTLAADSVTVTSSTGDNTSIPAATTTEAGVLSSTDKTKLDDLEVLRLAAVAADGDFATARSATPPANLALASADFTVTSDAPVETSGTAISSIKAGDLFVFDDQDERWERLVQLPTVTGGGATNLGRTLAANSVTITSSTGDNATIPAATTSAAGVLSGADKTKIDDLELLRLATVAADGAFATARSTTPPSNFALATADFTPSSDSPVDASGTALTSVKTGDLFIFDDEDDRWERLVTLPASSVTDLGRTLAADSVTITSSSGDDATVPAATTTEAGVLSSTDKTKIDDLEVLRLAAVAADGDFATARAATPPANFAIATAAFTPSTDDPVDVSGTDLTSVAIGDLFIFDDQDERWERLARIPAASATNLGRTLAADSVTITSSTGDDASIPAATATEAGVLSSTDKTKLDDLEALRLASVSADGNFATARGTTPPSNFALATADFTVSSDAPVETSGTAITSVKAGDLFLFDDEDERWERLVRLPTVTGGGATNLGRTLAADSVTVTSSTGDNASIPAATTSAAGVLSSTDKTKINDLEVLRLATVAADGDFATARGTTPPSNFAIATAAIATLTTDSPVDASGTALTSVAIGDLFIFDDEDERWEQLVNLPATIENYLKSVSFTDGQLTFTNQDDGTISARIIAATTGTADPTGGNEGDVYFKVDGSNQVVSVHLRGTTTWSAFTLPSGGSGATITTGTADPTGGAEGDLYIQTNATNVVQSIWRRGSTAWEEKTIPSITDYIKSVSFTGGQLTLTDQDDATTDVRVPTITVGTAAPSGGNESDYYIRIDASNNVVSLHRHDGTSWVNFTLPSGGGTISVGTGDPTGGADGDLYVETSTVVTNQVVSIWTRGTTAWQENTFETLDTFARTGGFRRVVTTLAGGDTHFPVNVNQDGIVFSTILPTGAGTLQTSANRSGENVETMTRFSMADIPAMASYVEANSVQILNSGGGVIRAWQDTTRRLRVRNVGSNSITIRVRSIHEVQAAFNDETQRVIRSLSTTISNYLKSASFTGGQLTLTDQADGTTDVRVPTITTGTADPSGGNQGDFYIKVDGSNEVVSVHRHNGTSWDAFTLPSGGSGGPTISSGTTDPTGGSSGDLYFKVSAGGDLVSIHLRDATTWTTIPLPTAPAGNARGALLATSSVLSTTGLNNGDIINVDWVRAPGAPSWMLTATSGGDNIDDLRFILGIPSDDVIGLWFVATVNNVEIDRLLYPWYVHTVANPSQRLLRFSAVNNDIFIEGNARHASSLNRTERSYRLEAVATGGTTETLPANSRVEVYWAVVRGAKGDPGTGVGASDIIGLRPMAPIYRTVSTNTGHALPTNGTAGTTTSGLTAWTTVPSGWTTARNAVTSALPYRFMLQSFQVQTTSGWQNETFVFQPAFLEEKFVAGATTPTPPATQTLTYGLVATKTGAYVTNTETTETLSHNISEQIDLPAPTATGQFWALEVPTAWDITSIRDTLFRREELTDNWETATSPTAGRDRWVTQDSLNTEISGAQGYEITIVEE